MATFSGNKDFFDLVNEIGKIKEKIVEKENSIDEIKNEYGIEQEQDETDISISSNVGNHEMSDKKELEKIIEN